MIKRKTHSQVFRNLFVTSHLRIFKVFVPVVAQPEKEERRCLPPNSNVRVKNII